MTDEQLIKQFLNGNEQAFNTLVWRWETRVYNFILRYIGEREEARDICQKTFIRLYRKIDLLRDHGKFSTWLYQIAVNMCRDELKKRSRSKVVSWEGLQENNNGQQSPSKNLPSESRANPEARVEKLDAANLLNRALQAIPEEQRMIIIMKEYQGLKFVEIAEILQISLSTAKSRMYYGLSALRKVFKKWKIDEEMLNYEV